MLAARWLAITKLPKNGHPEIFQVAFFYSNCGENHRLALRRSALLVLLTTDNVPMLWLSGAFWYFSVFMCSHSERVNKIE